MGWPVVVAGLVIAIAFVIAVATVRTLVSFARQRSAAERRPRPECHLIHDGVRSFQLNFKTMTGEYRLRQDPSRYYDIRRLTPGVWEKRRGGSLLWEALQEGFEAGFGNFDAIADRAYVEYTASIRDESS